MLYAANLPNAGASGDPRRLADLAELEEEASWDAILLEDYIVYSAGVLSESTMAIR